MNSATNQATSKTEATKGELRRGLKSRHLTMISSAVQLVPDYFASGGVIHSADLAVH